MTDYRVDIITEAEPDSPQRIEFFDAPDHDAAAQHALDIVQGYAAGDESVYGDLYARAPDSVSATYVDTIVL